MNREQEDMQFLGLYGVYKESFKIILSWRNIFSQITLTLVLPFSFIFLIHIQISHFLYRKIIHNIEEIIETPQGTPQYQNLSDMITSEYATFWLFKLVYFTFLFIFLLLSTSAVVYTIASFYTARDITFSKVMSVIPMVLKRLMVTFMCTIFAFLAYNAMAVFIFIVYALTIGVQSGGILGLVVIGILYLIGFVYLAVVWQLSSVVTVLEDSYGVEAMMMSNELIKGKMGLSLLIFLKLIVSFILVQFLFKKVEVVFVHGWRLSLVDRTAFGMLRFLMMSHLFIFGLVLQSVLYFVCKSYQYQNIDESDLLDDLEDYHGEYYEPLKAKDVHQEQSHV
ncbi:uncharacterized protein LOC133293541 [Gastrolobium bilobum]|uniref:uncharacterized protein LOC133293541 n=1 Tax=Gastrolobium bilobum TaxID=150636 RepID=UPI002AB1EB46|nr:uncharacterized protein LOC133293541 [Gastrolobium bilobum]